MAEIMSSCYHPNEWMGHKKRPQIMSVDDAPTWKKQITSHEEIRDRATEVAVSAQVGRAMREAMLKTRFADTIFKAALVLQGGNKSDVSSLQQQKPPLLLEKQHQQLKLHTRKGRSEAQIKAAEAATRRREQNNLKKQKPRSEAQIKAAEAASQRKEQYDLKKRRERERKAIQKMEKSVNVDHNAASMLREVEKLMGLPFGSGLGYPNTKQLERLGLYMKEDNYLEQDEDLEEGEILS